MNPIFVVDISSSWIERSLHAKFQLARLPKDENNNSVILEASLAPAEAEIGAVAKADPL